MTYQPQLSINGIRVKYLFYSGFLLAFVSQYLTVYSLNLPVISSLYVVATIVCFRAIDTVSYSKYDCFEPGFLFLTFVFVSFFPIPFFKLVGISVIKPRTILASESTLIKVTIAYFIIILSFTIGYLLLNLFARNETRKTSRHDIYKSNIWFYVAVGAVIFNFLIGVTLDVFHTRFEGLQHQLSLRFANTGGIFTQQFLGHSKKIGTIAIIFAVGIIAGRGSSPMKSLIRLFITVGLFFLWKFGLHGSRGSAVIIAVSAFCYINIIFWEGRLLKRKNLLPAQKH